MLTADDPRPIEQKRIDAALERAAEMFAVEGYAGLSMDDLAVGCGLSRASLYRLFGSTLGVLIAAAEHRLLPPTPHPPLVRAGDSRRFADPAERIAAAHERDADLEMVLRGVAWSGVPRARTPVARLDLYRRDAVESLLPTLGWQRDERLHLAALLLLPYAHHQLRIRAGWTERYYRDWVARTLHRIWRWSPPDAPL